MPKVKPLKLCFCQVGENPPVLLRALAVCMAVEIQTCTSPRIALGFLETVSLRFLLRKQKISLVKLVICYPSGEMERSHHVLLLMSSSHVNNSHLTKQDTAHVCIVVVALDIILKSHFQQQMDKTKMLINITV